MHSTDVRRFAHAQERLRERYQLSPSATAHVMQELVEQIRRHKMRYVGSGYRGRKVCLVSVTTEDGLAVFRCIVSRGPRRRLVTVLPVSRGDVRSPQASGVVDAYSGLQSG